MMISITGEHLQGLIIISRKVTKEVGQYEGSHTVVADCLSRN
jgi:hypothetical protein